MTAVLCVCNGSRCEHGDHMELQAQQGIPLTAGLEIAPAKDVHTRRCISNKSDEFYIGIIARNDLQIGWVPFDLVANRAGNGAMPSIRQLEAFYWSGVLGSFIATSRHLNTTQSNVSKRIQELEGKLQLKLFDRSKRSIRMTAAGQELMAMSEDILRRHGEIASLGQGPAMFRGTLKFGVIGSVAMTWLPDLIAAINERYPGILLRPEVRGSRTLHARLRSREIDFFIGTRPRSYSADFTMTPLTSLELVWVSSPGLFSSKDEISLEQLFKLPVISHTPESAGQRILEDLLGKVGVTPNYVITCNTLSALAGLVTAGLGITFMPKLLVAEDIQNGRVHQINVVPPLPPSPYVALINKDEIRPLPAQIVKIAQEVCDFSKRLSPGSGSYSGQDISAPTRV